jgi:hypothetical protein
LWRPRWNSDLSPRTRRWLSLQSERLEVLMQKLGLADLAQGYEVLAEQAAQKELPY